MKWFCFRLCGVAAMRRAFNWSSAILSLLCKFHCDFICKITSITPTRIINWALGGPRSTVFFIVIFFCFSIRFQRFRGIWKFFIPLYQLLFLCCCTSFDIIRCWKIRCILNCAPSINHLHFCIGSNALFYCLFYITVLFGNETEVFDCEIKPKNVPKKKKKKIWEK